MNAQRQIELRILAQHRVIAERLLEEREPVIQHARNNLERWRASYGAGDRPRWMAEWEGLLAGPTEDLLEVLIGDTDAAARLRSSSPFAGVLSARERWRILKECDHAAA